MGMHGLQTSENRESEESKFREVIKIDYLC